jgi:hypothetical protein
VTRSDGRGWFYFKVEEPNLQREGIVEEFDAVNSGTSILRSTDMRVDAERRPPSHPGSAIDTSVTVRETQRMGAGRIYRRRAPSVPLFSQANDQCSQFHTESPGWEG